jgi:hypothetical protein
MKLRSFVPSLGVLMLAASAVAGPSAPAPKNPAPVAPPVNDDLGITAGLGYHTNYIWRGVNFGQHWVDASLAGAIPLMESTRLAWDVNYGSLAGDQDHITSNALPPPFTMGGNSFQRLQLGAAFQRDVGAVTVSLGYRYFRNMGGLTQGAAGPLAFFNNDLGMRDGQEVSLGLATAIGPINVATSANFDFVNDSWYFDFDANTNIAITDSISVVPFFNVGYGKNQRWQFNQGMFTGPGPFPPGFLDFSGASSVSGWTAINTGFRFPIKLNSRATLTPYVAANLPLGSMNNLGFNAFPFALGTNDTAFKSVLTGGVTLSVRF